MVELRDEFEETLSALRSVRDVVVAEHSPRFIHLLTLEIVGVLREWVEFEQE